MIVDFLENLQWAMIVEWRFELIDCWHLHFAVVFKEFHEFLDIFSRQVGSSWLISEEVVIFIVQVVLNNILNS